MYRKVDKRLACDHIERWIKLKTFEELGNDLGISGERARQYANEMGIAKPSRRTATLRAEIQQLRQKLSDLETPQDIAVA